MMHIRHSHKTSYTITQNEKVWTVQETTEEKDLGVICTADLKVSHVVRQHRRLIESWVW